VTRLQAGWPVFDSWQGAWIFSLPLHTNWLWAHSQTPIQWVLGAHSHGIKQLRCETEHSPPSSAKKECVEL